MQPKHRNTLMVGIIVTVCALIGLWIWAARKPPTAMIRVVDATGHPVFGAVILSQGLRPKPGPYQGGWYAWSAPFHKVTNATLVTDAEGWARLRYPKYVFERIETGTLCLTVHHADYVSQRPERVVATAPPAGAPWLEVASYWMETLFHRRSARIDPIVMEQGGALTVTVPDDPDRPSHARMFVQVSQEVALDTSFWRHLGPRTFATHRLSPGMHTVRALLLNGDGAAWFSGVEEVHTKRGETNHLELVVRPGVTVRGELDASVPRPLTRGRVVAHVWPVGCKPSEDPPVWHGWTAVNEDGSFVIPHLPTGNLELVAMCDGFVSVNGPGTSTQRRPQVFDLGQSGLEVSIPMEATARLEVRVSDEHGRPLSGVAVSTWPNIRYGDWGARILMSDCYNLADWFLADNDPGWFRAQRGEVPDLHGVSDDEGLAVVPNLPITTTAFAVTHSDYELPVQTNNSGRAARQVSISLMAGETNHVTVRLERRGSGQIRHY